MGWCIFPKGICRYTGREFKASQKEKGLKIHAWCIMSNYVHLIASATEPNRLSDILRDLKKFTSTNIIKAISENDTESRISWMQELQVGMLWILKAAGDKNNRNKLPSLPERGWGWGLWTRLCLFLGNWLLCRRKGADWNWFYVSESETLFYIWIRRALRER